MAAADASALSLLARVAPRGSGAPAVGSGEAVEQFVHHVVDHACGSPVDFGSLFTCAADGKDLLQPAVDACAALLLSTGLTPSKLPEALAPCGLSDVAVAAVVTVAGARQHALLSARMQAVTSISARHLVDFDWSLRMVVSSDKMASLRHPVVVLTLMLSDGTSVLVELPKPRLAEVLKEFAHLNHVFSTVSVTE